MKITYQTTTFFLTLLIIITTIILIILNNKDNNNNVDLKIKERDSLALRDSILTEIYNLRIEHPYIVYAQAIVESGNFTSKIWKENHNMFGMKMPERRATLAKKIRYGHAVYNNWRECLIDYSLYQMAYMKGLDENQYFNKLQNFYAQDSQYVEKIKKIKNSLKNRWIE